MKEKAVLRWFVRLFQKAMKEYPEDPIRKEKIYGKIRKTREK